MTSNQQSQQPETVYENFLRREKAKYLKLRDGDTILDIGGGSGEVWRAIGAYEKYWLHNVEPDKKLAKRGEDIYSLFFDSILYVPIKSIKEYDYVCLMGLLEHLDNPLNDMLVHLAKARKIYITVPNAESYHRYVGRELKIISAIDELGPQDHAIGHKRVYSPKTMKALVDKFNRMVDYKYKIKMWTTSFKFLDSNGMMEFADKFDALNAAAEQSGIIGTGDHGAEIVVELERLYSW